MKNMISAGAMLVGLAAAGILAALVVAAPAAAWDWHSLPSGYSVVSSYTSVCHVATDPCVNGEGSICTHLTIDAGTTGTRFAETDCVNPTFDHDLDAFVNSTICAVNPAAGGQACATPSVTTNADPPATTTADPGQPNPAPPATETTSTSPVTVTVTTTTADPSVDDRLATIEAQISDLESRVQRLELASTAAQLAYEQSLGNGATPASAADTARGTYLNAEYGLGAFA